MIGFERPITNLRALARTLGLIPYLDRVRNLLRHLRGEVDPELRFSRALMRQVRGSDVVWDIGANVGTYTLPLSDAVADGGRVIAFEPLPTCFAALQQRCAGRSNVHPLQVALGDRGGSARLSVNGDELSTTSSLFVAPGATTIEVPIATGDTLVAEGEVPAPHVIKIDVEGFEEEVLRGIEHLLDRPECRAVLCEVHFKILDERGERHAPSRIVQRLRRHGFATRWIDASHVAALRES